MKKRLCMPGDNNPDKDPIYARLAKEYGRTAKDAVKASASVAASAAGAAGRGGGKVVVGGLDFLKSKANPPLIFFLFVAAFQIFELVTNYGIPLILRLFIYLIVFVIAAFGIGMGTRQAAVLTMFSVLTPYVRERLPTEGAVLYLNALMLLPALSWALWIGLTSSYRGISELFRLGIVSFIVFIVVWPNLYAITESMGVSQYVPKLDPKQGWKTVEDSIAKAADTAKQIPPALKKAWEDRLHATLGDYYTGKVDENSKKPIGVFIEKLTPADSEYYEGQKVVIITDIRAETLEDPVTISPKCWSDKERSDELQGLVFPQELEVETVDRRYFDCRFPRLKPGTRRITAAATFNFETMAYLKTYYMDKDKIRSMRREGLEPLDFYGIRDKDPVAIFTNGPVYIGMQVPKPPIGLKPGDTNQLYVGVTLSNKEGWQGRIDSLSELKIELPKGITVDEDDGCTHIFKFKGVEDDYNVYYLDIDAERLSEPDKFTNIEKYQSFRCFLKVEDNQIDEILGNVPITTKFFRASAKYIYSAQKEMSLEIKAKEKPPAGMGGDIGNGIIDLSRRGLGRPYQDNAEWDSGSIPKSNDPISPGAFVSWVYSRYESLHKGSCETVPSGISEQSSAGELVDGDMSSQSKPDYNKIVGGDEMFFCGSYDASTGSLTDCSNGIGHAGIYTGNERIIHVAKTVKEEVLSGSSLEDNYVGARRVCKTAAKGSGTGSGGDDEKPVDTGDVISTIKYYAKKYRVPEEIALKVGMLESGLQHYQAPYTAYGNCDGNVKCGDSGFSLGVMQINTHKDAHSQCYGKVIYNPNSGDMCNGAQSCSGTDVRDMKCNIEASMRHLRNGYDQGQNSPSAKCSCGQYSGWEYALKYYNGCVCSINPTYVSDVMKKDVSQYLT